MLASLGFAWLRVASLGFAWLRLALLAFAWLCFALFGVLILPLALLLMSYLLLLTSDFSCVCLGAAKRRATLCGDWSVMELFRGGIHCAWHVLSYILLRCGETYVLALLSGGLLCAAIGLSWRCVVE